MTTEPFVHQESTEAQLHRYLNGHSLIPFDPASLTTLLTPVEVAKRLSISRAMVYVLLSSGALRSLTIGRCRRVRLADLAAFIGEQARATEGGDAG
ncbi:MAG: helix-turn-helix domain-containing protein [Acidimicrobiales bacterium]